MAAAHPLPAQVGDPGRAGEAVRASNLGRAGVAGGAGEIGRARAASLPDAKAATSEALVPFADPDVVGAESAFKPLVMRLPVELEVSVPVRDFRVRNLLALAPGQVIESQWSNGNDLPLAARDVQLAWTEFEVMESRLAVRVTRVA